MANSNANKANKIFEKYKTEFNLKKIQVTFKYGKNLKQITRTVFEDQKGTIDISTSIYYGEMWEELFKLVLNKGTYGLKIFNDYNTLCEEKFYQYNNENPDFLSKILEPQEQRVIELYYGLGNKKRTPKNEITEELNLTWEGIRQIIVKAQLKIINSNIFDNLFMLDKNNGLDEINNSTSYVEGVEKEITTNVYERNIQAKQECIKYYGTQCQICSFDFKNVYGEGFKNLIHVHHLKPLSEIKQEYIVDPVKDLIPVCPNCHMVLHSKGNGETYKVEEVRNMIIRNKLS